MATIKNNTARVINLGGLFALTPGNNLIDDALYRQAVRGLATNIPVKHMFDTKDLEVFDAPADEVEPEVEEVTDELAKAPPPPATGLAKTGSSNLSNLKEKEAISRVADTLDRATLEAYRIGENRRKVLSAIDEQIELTKLAP